jgi:hypothetical protein
MSDPAALLEEDKDMRTCCREQKKTMGGNIVDLRIAFWNSLRPRLDHVEDTHPAT